MASRPQGKPYAGWWEFPGGKLEAGEAVTEALSREYAEELGVKVKKRLLGLCSSVNILTPTCVYTSAALLTGRASLNPVKARHFSGLKPSNRLKRKNCYLCVRL